MSTNTAVSPNPRRKGRKIKVTRRGWFLVGVIFILSFIPTIAAGIRLFELGSRAEVTPDNARFFAMPFPIIIHLLGTVIYAIVGGLQFIRGIRIRNPRLHQKLGRFLLLPSGLAVAITGLWMTLLYPWPKGDGVILYFMRLVVGVTMVIQLVMGYLSIQQKNFKAHGVWMLRAYALGMGAGTQAFTHIPWEIAYGEPTVFVRAMLMGAGWLINVIIAELIIRYRINKPKNTHKATVAHS